MQWSYRRQFQDKTEVVRFEDRGIRNVFFFSFIELIGLVGLVYVDSDLYLKS